MKAALIAPFGMVGGLTSLSAAALLAGLTSRDGRWWEAAIHLAVLGGLLPLMYAVNHRIVPVFSRRQWRHEVLWFAIVGASLAAGVVSAAGIRLSEDVLVQGGALLALCGGVLFVGQIRLIFTSPLTGPPPPLPFESQRDIDRIATRFSRLAGMYLLAGLATGVVTSFFTPERGRWDLVWAHLLLLGCVISMASSVTYHVLPRWTSGRWRTPRLASLHLVLSLIATPAMVLALAIDETWLFRLGGPVQAAALLLWGINCVPLLTGLPSPTRAAWFLASAFLGIGISLGAAFALREKFGPIYRQVHAEFNLFGWAGFLVQGAAYYLVPRFAGSAIRWPRLAPIQFAMLAIAIFVSGVVRRLQNSGRGDFQFEIELTHLVMAVVLVSFAVQVVMAFRAAPPAPILLTTMRRERKLRNSRNRSGALAACRNRIPVNNDVRYE